IWLNDGFDYPPGSVGGQIEKIDPTLKQLHINLDEQGELKVYEANRGFPAFENPKSSELFIELVYERYLKEVGEYFGNTIVGFFSDADNRRVLPEVLFKKDSTRLNYFPWAVNFEERFEAKYGYDITPFMKDVIARRDIPQAEDYWEFAGLLYQSWFKNNYAWHRAHGLMYTGHSSDSSPYTYGEAPRSSLLTEGRFSDIQSNFDFPGTDHELFSQDGGRHMRIQDWYAQKQVWGLPLKREKMPNFADVSRETRVKQAASTAFMYDKKGVMCEMFAATNFGATPSDLRRISAFQIMQGVTFIVPHAYHHKFFGPAKYFAPPDFSRHSMHNPTINAFNDEMSERCCMMAKGKLIAPIALLDPACAVWRNKFNSTEYFRAFSQLNRLPYGFVICDYKKVVSQKLGFKVAVIAGFELSEEEKKGLKDAGITLISGDELDKLKELIPCSVSYVGEGTPYIIRKDIDGEEFTFISNVEGYEPVKGVISAYGRQKDILLYPGDIYYISKNYDDIPDLPRIGTHYVDLPDVMDVTFSAPNNILLERWEKDGEGMAKTDDCSSYDFVFESTFECPLVLKVPEISMEKITKITFNGAVVDKGEFTRIFDENYSAFALQAVAGKNVLSVEKKEVIHFSERIILEGEFDLDLNAEYDEYKNTISIYNASTFVPKYAKIAINPRRTALSTKCSWALQGQNFYSGLCTYSTTLKIEEDGEYRISLNKVSAILELSVDGEKYAKLFHAPYSYELRLQKGEHKLEFAVINTFGNALEGYAEDSGIMDGVKVEKI
ncbi:MAG: hypothetical protein IJF76_01045, partial [Clostridia bacterium]|nr:hypothetical protein [Clostridia bacterium]